MICRCEPGTKTLSIATIELDTGRPRNGLGFHRRRGISNSVHFKRALTLSTEGRKDVLLLFLSKSLSLLGEEMQPEYKCRIETAVGHWERPGQLSIHKKRIKSRK